MMILVYNLEKQKEAKIRILCGSMGIEVVVVSPAHYLEPVGALAGVRDIESLGIEYSGPAFADEMLIFCNFTNDSLTGFLKAYRENDTAAISLKATLTPYNVIWNSLQLRDELKKEHEELTKKTKDPS